MDTEMSKYLIYTGVATAMAIGWMWFRVAKLAIEVADRQLVGS